MPSDAGKRVPKRVPNNANLTTNNATQCRDMPGNVRFPDPGLGGGRYWDGDYLEVIDSLEVVGVAGVDGQAL